MKPDSNTAGARPYHHGDLRAALLKAAHAALEEGGVEALSFRALARAVGVSQTAPYNHFDGRDGLLADLAQQGFEELGASQTVAASATGEFNCRLVSLGLDYVGFARRRPQLYRLMFGVVLPDWHDRPNVAAAKMSSLQPVKSVLADAGTGRSWSDRDVDAAALAAWSLVHGLAMLRIDRAFAQFDDALNDGQIERRAILALARGLQ